MNISKSKLGWIILKLDIRKAFGSISWCFILDLLKAYNLPPQRISLIESCFSHIEYTPILIGSKLALFKPNRGNRQEDPLSPYLFIMAMEYLSNQISNAINAKTWKPFKLKNQNFRVSHLFFADDVLLFAKVESW